MTINELESYFNKKWNSKDFRESVTQLSKSDKGYSLVKSKFEMFNFDAITQDIYESEQPSSVDGIYFSKGNLHLVEFKTGFYQKVRKGRSDFNDNTAKCDCLGSVCDKYWNEFTKRQDKEIEILLDSLKLKALETYLFLEKQIGFIKNKSDSGRVILQIVIDENGIDGMETGLSDLADSSISRVNKSMQRFKKQRDINQNIYCYDEIEVYTGDGFSHILNK